MFSLSTGVATASFTQRRSKGMLRPRESSILHYLMRDWSELALAKPGKFFERAQISQILEFLYF